MLVVGPNPAFLDHIGRVLPSLGETNVVFMTTGDLLPWLRVTAEDAPDVARLKGSRAIMDVLAAAVADRQRSPEQPLSIELADATVRIDAETTQWAIQEARASGLPHNEARAVFYDVLTWALTERAIAWIGRGWLTRADRAAWEQLRTELLEELAEHDAFNAAVDELWPILMPETVLAELYTSRERLLAAGADPVLWRADGEAWTVSDVPLLDELFDLLGRDRAAQAAEEAAAERERKAEAAYAAGVLDLMVSREDLMDDEDRLLATDMLYAEDLAERFDEHDTRDVAERAAADRDWTYRHIVVDEAQELSEMDWRALMRRCPGRSFTVVGDLAQRRSAAGATSWDAMLEPYVPGRWVYRSLSVNYRTPAEIMTVAAALLAEFAPGVTPPESVRACGVQPWSRRVTARRTTHCHRGIRLRRGHACRHQRRDRAAGRAGHGAGLTDQGSGVRRRAGGGAGTDHRRRATWRSRALRRPHSRHSAPRDPAPWPVAAGPDRPRRKGYFSTRMMPVMRLA